MRRGRTLLQAVVLAAAAAAVYWPALRGGWLWDDEAEILNNRALRTPAGLRAIWEGKAGPDYFPLKETVQWAQWHLWHHHVLGYHLTNLGLHIVGALLLWQLLSKLGVRLAWLGGLLFAVHPLAVDSVAWMSELKNVLSFPLLVLAFGAFISFDHTGRTARYAWSIGLFLLALLAKTSVVVLPLLLLLYVVWKHGRIRPRDLARIAPFFLIACVLGMVTVVFQHHAAPNAATAAGGVAQRVSSAWQAALFYADQALVPAALMPVYPAHLVIPWATTALLAVLLVGFIAFGKRALLFGGGCFVAGLLPVLGLVPMAYQGIAPVSDHFAYLALAAAAAVLATVFGAVIQHSKAIGIVAAAALSLALAVRARAYAANFRSAEAFWSFAIRANPSSWVAHDNLGTVYRRSGRLPAAVAEFQESLRLKPDYIEAHANLALAESQENRLPEAVEQYEEAIRLKPDFAEARYNLGFLLAGTGRFDDAAGQFQAALKVNPDYAEAHYSLGDAFASMNRLPEAIAEFHEALRCDPDYAYAHNDLGIILAQSGQPAEALEHFRRAAALRPGDEEIQRNLQLALAHRGAD